MFILMFGMGLTLSAGDFRRIARNPRATILGTALQLLVMPVVITGLSLLVFFIALEGLIGWPAGRGMDTITIAHITFSMAFFILLGEGRLIELILGALGKSPNGSQHGDSDGMGGETETP